MHEPGEHGVEDAMALLVADLYLAAGLSRRLGEQLAKVEGQSQARWQVLSVLSDGPWTVAQAARRLGTARQAVQRVTRELAQDGLLSTRDNPDHRTSPLFELTLKGERTLARMNAAAADVHREQLKKLSRDEVAQLHLGLQRLIAVLDES
jgi:DNA-binding MarR family transcriptional regulator